MTTDNRPISRLDEALDDLVRALARMPALEDYITAMRLHEQIAAHIGPDTPGAVDVLAGAEFRGALIDVAAEVLAVRRKGADHGRS